MSIPSERIKIGMAGIKSIFHLISLQTVKYMSYITQGDKIMNILFFLTPKIEVAYIDDTCYIREALEKMKHYGYTAIPIINAEGKYIGTATEGDFLWMFLEQRDRSVGDIQHMRVRDMMRRTINEPVSINSDIADLITLAMKQNFVPVIDDDKVFIGIVTRKDILQYCHEKIFK